MFELLKTFVAVVENGSLSKAAEQLHANQPNLSVRIQRLEENLGVKLFDREGKRLVLNPVGRRMYKQTKSLLNMYDNMQEEIKLFERPDAGHIRIGGGFQLLSTTLPPFLTAFSDSFPNITYEINEIGPSYETYQLVDQYKIDYGIVDTKHPYENIQTEPLGIQSQINLVVPKHHRVAEEEKLSVEDLNDLSFITFKKGTKIMNEMEERFEEAGVTLPVRMESGHIEMIIKMVEMGMGAAFLPLITGSHILLDKEVQVMNVEGLDFPAKPIDLIYRKNRYYPASLLTFKEQLIQYFQK
ncbi:LysR family transcriptional regulator [Thalassobacillus hwangdonensis]|uniref:LysR family transcriptional regulator n=1 Tax=Thalassobacillus hwangdonensis TaxID=546108 RepID=A0ABW3L0V1_9BACI